ncbi:MAG: hypothetical protein JWQ71_2027 [Pedosphaera sp.]|nr:hypothetical protein [Pedosphaera sp.]
MEINAGEFKLTMLQKSSLFPGFCLKLSVAIWLVTLICSPLARGESIMLIPNADTSIMEITPTNNAGGRSWLNVGGNHYGQRNRALVKFDIAGNIPPHSQIISASLNLNVTGVPGDGYDVGFFDLHRLLRDWGEGNKNPSVASGQGSPASTNDATWLSPMAYTTNLWSVPGGGATNDYAATVTASQIVYDQGQNPYQFPDAHDSPAPMIADIQMWLDHPGTNFGWIIICESEAVPNTVRRLASREDPDTENAAPLLNIEYIPPSPPIISSVQQTRNQLKIFFTAEAGRSYVVQFCNNLSSTNLWSTLTNISQQSLTTNLVVTDSITNSRRFYRLERY